MAPGAILGHGRRVTADPESLDRALGRLPRLGLAHLPTPLQPMPRLSAHLGGPRLWVKREDCAGPDFGGNKLRKLDYVLHPAVAAGADTLVSGGVVQSNSQRQVAAAAARIGMACHLVVFHGRLAPPTALYAGGGNALLNGLFGAVRHDRAWTGDRNGPIQALAARLAAEGRRPHIVPYGASDPLGAAGYASCAGEIARQCAESGIRPAAIVHCSGSAATQAGLAVGAALAMPATRVVGIDIDAEPERVCADVARLAAGAAALLGLPFDGSAIEVVAGHAGPAYGVPHAATFEALALGARLEGLVLDPVYSAKGLAGLIALVRAGRWRAGEDVVFVHTGGAPSLFAYGPAVPA
ncbi:MAG: D-cysteine desulfhydrase family protein [Alphaproteobacteria bacterium]